MSDPQLTLIAAVAANGIIGKANSMPWRSKADLQHFANTTRNHCVIMGHRTYRSIGHALIDRRNFVVSRQSDLQLPDCQVCSSLDNAIIAARKVTEDTIFVAGGAEVYLQALPLADAMIISRMHLEPEGDAHFPDYDTGEWELERSEAFTQEDPPFEIEWLRRII